MQHLQGKTLRMTTHLQLILMLIWLQSVTSINAGGCPVQCECDIPRRLVDCTSGAHRHLKTIPANLPADTEILIMDRNNISSINNDSLSHLRHLKTFSAKNCLIVRIENGAFNNLKKLTMIELEGNRLSSFTIMHKLPVLSHLNLKNNRIKSYNNISLCDMPLLTTLDLSSNMIKSPALSKDFSCLQNLATFLLDHNTLHKVDATDFAPLANSSIRTLSMSNCSLRIIYKGALVPVKDITTLTLNSNNFTKFADFENSMHALCSLPALENLDLDRNQIKNYTAQSFKCLQSLKYLNLQFNYIMHLPANGFDTLISLEYLNLAGNKITTISKTALKGLNQVKTLTISDNQLLKLPLGIFSSKTDKTYMPKIEKIIFCHNRMRHLSKENFKGLDNLRWLDIGRNQIKYLDNGVFHGLHSLTHLSINHNNLRKIHKDAFATLNKTLVYLSLAGNRYGFVAGQDFLKKLPRLTDLFLGDNRIQDCKLLKNLIPKDMRQALRRLSMNNMGIGFIPPATFRGMFNLQKLDLSDNNIASWVPKVFSKLPSLTQLLLRNNNIRILNESSLGNVWYQLKRFSADHNQYSCNCDILWFLDWFKNATTHNVTILRSQSDSYNCAFPKYMAKKSIFTYKPKNLECVAWWLIVTPSVAGFLILLLLSTTLGCWYRHHLRLCCFRYFGIGYKDYEAVDGNEHDYDVFISYSQDDMAWVIQTLVHKLEHQFGFKAFFEDRDYNLGEMMVDNIISGIESSRRVIIVLSQSFLEGQWCGLEVQLIQKKLLKKLIVIKRDDVKDFKLSPTLGWIIREQRYIEWNEHPVAQELFWEKLKHAIEEIPDKPRLCALC